MGSLMQLDVIDNQKPSIWESRAGHTYLLSLSMHVKRTVVVINSIKWIVPIFPAQYHACIKIKIDIHSYVHL